MLLVFSQLHGGVRSEHMEKKQSAHSVAVLFC